MILHDLDMYIIYKIYNDISSPVIFSYYQLVFEDQFSFSKSCRQLGKKKHPTHISCPAVEFKKLPREDYITPKSNIP